MRERLTIDYQYTLMTKLVRDGIFKVNNSHFKEAFYVVLLQIIFGNTIHSHPT